MPLGTPTFGGGDFNPWNNNRGSGGSGGVIQSESGQPFGAGFPMSPVTPGGGFGSPVPQGPGYSSPSIPAANPYNSYMAGLQNQLGMINSQYDSLINSVGSGLTGLGPDVGRTTRYANQNRDFALRQIASDLSHGLFQNKVGRQRAVTLGGFRNNADWWGAQQAWRGANTRLNESQGFTREQWDEFKRNNKANRGFALDDRRLGRRSIDLDFARQNRAVTSDATARGARTSAGFADAVGELETGRDINIDKNVLQHRKTTEGLLNDLNKGRISFKDAMSQIRASRRTNNLNKTMARKTYSINKQDLGLQRHMFNSQAAQMSGNAKLARERAAAAANQQIGTARSQRDQMEAQAAQQAAAQRAALQAQRLGASMDVVNQILAMGGSVPGFSGGGGGGGTSPTSGGLNPRQADAGGSGAKLGPAPSHHGYSGLQPQMQTLARQALGQFPGLTFSSGYRDPDRNRAAGGVPNSNHTRGAAMDFTGSSSTMQQAVNWFRSQGVEAAIHPNGSGNGGYHVHVGG